MNFVRMYEHYGEPFSPAMEGTPHIPFRYRLGVANDGFVFAVPVDAGPDPINLGWSWNRYGGEPWLNAGTWTLYEPTTKDKTVNLNIDYAEIIRKADHRRAVLKELEEELQQLPATARKVVEGLAHLAHLKGLYDGLDMEGQKLVGPAGQLLSEVGGSARSRLSWYQDEERVDGFPRLFKALGLEYDLS